MNIADPTDKNRSDWKAWVASRPAIVREIIDRHAFEPWKLYRMKSTGHRVTIAAFDEPESGGVMVRVDVSGAFNLVAFERQVFGIDPDDLEECDLPAPDEPLGSLGMSIEEVKKRVEALKSQKT